MPFVRVSVSPNFDDDRMRRIAQGVHQAMVREIDVPSDDRFGIVERRSPGEMIWDRGYLGVERSDEAVFVSITLAAGRSDAKKRALYAAIAANLENADVRPSDVLIVLTENARVDWSFGDGVAQYVPSPAA